MGTLYDEYVSQHYGKEQDGPVFGLLHRALAEGRWKKLPANWLSGSFGKVWYGAEGGMFGFSDLADYLTETLDNSSTRVMGVDGVRYASQASPTGNDDFACTWDFAHTPGTSKWVNMGAYVKKSDLDDVGFRFGIVTAGSTEIFSAAPANGVYFASAINSGIVTGNTTENTNAAAASATLHTFADDTFVFLEMVGYIGTTALLTTGAWYANGVETSFTAAQNEDLFEIVNTTPASLSMHVGWRVNSTTQRIGTVGLAYACVDR